MEHINYEDEMLVECVYKMYEQYERSGEAYLHSQIFEDIKLLDKEAETGTDAVEKAAVNEMEEAETVERSEQFVQKKKEKKSFLSLLGDRRRQDKEARDNYRENLQRAMAGYAVAEEADYEPLEYGRTVCMEEKEEPKTVHRYRLFTQEGRLLTWINTSAIILGKKREEVDVCLEDISVSRIHARVVKEEEKVYIEDLNSTNGTLINGQRLQPYEKRKLEEGDEIKCGKTVLIFR